MKEHRGFEAWQGNPGPSNWYTYFVTPYWPHEGEHAIDVGDVLTCSHGRFEVTSISVKQSDTDEGWGGEPGVTLFLRPLEERPS